ncbi:hypothetical protein PsalMR5_04574 (plasmid) [Piscirickettsia salmonis]|uniref:hypothetical protein n=1 Tax=Piscirickettsia salmonis TaxID=1238 RepID=UPI0012BA99F9|nr:hypothetical protein [Piscirickettsia salmonis]QGP66649.1 hypothetical protein PsalMR5_04574 [Piscirickettsia salmonis]
MTKSAAQRAATFKKKQETLGKIRIQKWIDSDLNSKISIKANQYESLDQAFERILEAGLKSLDNENE